MTSLTIGLENSGGGCGWVKIIANRFTRTNIEHLVDVASDYGKRINDFLTDDTVFPDFSEFRQTIESIDEKCVGNVQADLNLEDFSDNDIKNIFCRFFKKNDGPVHILIFVEKGDGIDGIDVSSEGSVQRIDQAFRPRMTN